MFDVQSKPSIEPVNLIKMDTLIYGVSYEGSKFTIIDTDYYVDQDPEYPKYPIGWNEFLSMMKTNTFDLSC